MTKNSWHFWLTFLACVAFSLTLTARLNAEQHTVGSGGDFATIALALADEGVGRGDTLTLLTCDTWNPQAQTFVKRLVVRARLVEVQPIGGSLWVPDTARIYE